MRPSGRLRKREGVQVEKKVAARQRIPGPSKPLEPGAAGDNESAFIFKFVKNALEDVLPFRHLVAFVETGPREMPLRRDIAHRALEEIRVQAIGVPDFPEIPVVI